MAEYSTFNIIISNVAGALFEGEVRSVSVPSVGGVMVVLAHHEPLIALLQKGTIRLETGDGEQRSYDISNGVLEVGHNKAIILV